MSSVTLVGSFNVDHVWRCDQLPAPGATIAGRNYRPPGFRLALGLKDIRLALAAGEGARVPLPFASVLRDAFLEAIAHGDADLDWAAVAEVARRRAGSEDGAGKAQRA